MISWQFGALCLAAAAEAAYAFAPAQAPSVRAAPLRMSASNAPSRRDFLSVSVASGSSPTLSKPSRLNVAGRLIPCRVSGHALAGIRHRVPAPGTWQADRPPPPCCHLSSR